MDEFKISLQAEIDKAKSKGQINSDINALGSQVDKLKIQVDTSNITKSIKKAIQDAFKSLPRNISLPGVSGDSGTSKLKSEYQQLMSMAKQMSSIRVKIAGLDTSKNKAEIDTLIQQLNVLKSSYSSLSQSAGGNLSTTQLANLQTVIDGTNNKIDVLNAKLTDTKSKMSEGIKYKIDVGDYATDIAKVQAQFEKWGMSSDEVGTHMKDLRTAYNDLINPENADKRIENEKIYQQQLQKTKNEIARLSVTTASTFDKQNLSNKIKTWLEQNTAASREAQEQLRSYLSDLEKVDLANIEFKNMKQGFEDLKFQQRALGNLGKSWNDTFKAGMQKFVDWGLASGAVMKVVQGARDMYQAVYDVDTAMTNLYKVTDETDAKYNAFLTNACSNAKELGRSVSGLIEQSANWAKLGYSIDESEQLAKISSIYANVGEVDDETAVSDMVTVMKAYDITADKAISIVNKYNKLGNEFATSAKDLGEGMSNAASMLSLGGTDINKALALLTGGAEITQSAGELGNALKIGQMRVQGMKGSLEELGEEVDEDVESISKMQTHILNLTNGEVNIFDENNNFKDYYDILEDVSKIIDELSSTERADLLETLFGKNRANQGAAVLQAFQSGQVQKAYEATLNADGSAQEEQERWMQSLEAKTQQFQAAFQSLSNTVLDSDIPKFFVDLGTNGVSALDFLIDKFGTLATLTPIVTGVLNKQGLGLTNYVTIS